jgi:uncharacterized membrane protein
MVWPAYLIGVARSTQPMYLANDNNPPALRLSRTGAPSANTSRLFLNARYPLRNMSDSPISTDDGQKEPEPKPLKQHHITHVVGASTRFSGPFPPPILLREYKEIQDDLVERIVQLAEREQAHAHSQDKRHLDLVEMQLKEDAVTTRRASQYGLLIVFAFLAVGAAAIFTGQPYIGVAIMGGCLATVLAIYLGRKPPEGLPLPPDSEGVPRIDNADPPHVPLRLDQD